jgi:hypothetical protein
MCDGKRLWLHLPSLASAYSIELRLMGPAEREAVEEEDAWNKGPRNDVEMNFNKIVRKFTRADYFPKH